MKTKYIITPLFGLVAASLVGCARFHTKQVDTFTNNETNSAAGLQTRTTEVTAYTLFSAKSSLASFKATQGDKTQSANVGELSQQGGTNTVAVLEAIARIIGSLPK